MILPEDPRRLNCRFNLETIGAHVQAQPGDVSISSSGNSANILAALILIGP
jgi:hypothetical protein